MTVVSQRRNVLGHLRRVCPPLIGRKRDQVSTEYDQACRRASSLSSLRGLQIAQVDVVG